MVKAFRRGARAVEEEDRKKAERQRESERMQKKLEARVAKITG